MRGVLDDEFVLEESRHVFRGDGVGGVLENPGITILTCPQRSTDFGPRKTNVRVRPFLIGEGRSSVGSRVEGLLDLLVDDLPLLKVEGAVAVCVGTVDEVRFQKDFAVSFDDVMLVHEKTVDVPSLAAEMMGCRLIDGIAPFGLNFSKDWPGERFPVMGYVRPCSISEAFA